MPSLLQNATQMTDGKDAVYQASVTLNGQQHAVAIKSFRSQRWLKGWFDRHKGSKAKRSWLAAQHLAQHNIGTPQPIAYLEKWQGYRLIESYYISMLSANMSSFRQELSQLLWDEPDNEKLIGLLEAIAPAVRKMHDSGLMHGDMGNQNILLQRLDPHQWHNVQFIDLNRAQLTNISPGWERAKKRLFSWVRRHNLTAATSRSTLGLSWQKRAYDLSRLAIPSDYLRVFKLIYSNGPVEPALDKYEMQYRNRYRRHNRTYKLRHPIRAWRHHKACQQDTNHRLDYPAEQDLWLWDQRSAQAMVMLSSKDRKRHYHKTDWLRIATDTLRHALPTWRLYKRYIEQSFQAPVAIQGRLGIAIHPHPDYIDYEFEQIVNLGKPPVLIRFCCHETQTEWDITLSLIKRYRKANVQVAVALLQNRHAVTSPSYWQQFVDYIVPNIHDQVRFIEVGHATNRVKWGIWRQAEYRALLTSMASLQQRYPNLRLTGPAGIDFEYPQILPLLCRLPKALKLDALSHHLYVDRRGAPENHQGSFSTLEKCALAKALTQCTVQCQNKLIISEVNWPLKGTGVYSPIGSPYQTPGTRPENEPGVTEAEYANYMIRYISIALCSGHVESIYWWRLSAHGYGLIDDLNRPSWRPRPAFKALATWLKLLGQSQFIKRLESEPEVYLLIFKAQAAKWVLAWSHPEPRQITLPFCYKKQLDLFGSPLTNPADDDKLTLHARPCYFLIE